MRLQLSSRKGKTADDDDLWHSISASPITLFGNKKLAADDDDDDDL